MKVLNVYFHLNGGIGYRLRAADMPLETRKVLLGHRNGDITTHYSAPELEELLTAVNKVCEEKSGTGYAETKKPHPRVRLFCIWRARHD